MPWITLLKTAFRPQPAETTGTADPLPQWAYGGLETQTDPKAYIWNGLKRGADPRHPFVILQYTLAGEGQYEEKKRRYALRAGEAFFTVIPSAHRYQLPAHSPQWTFYWIIIHHEEVVAKLVRLQREFGPVLTLAPDAAIHTLSAQLCQHIVRNDFEDRYAFELALWEWTLELERHLTLQRTPAQGRERLLNWTRQQWSTRTTPSLSVTELARRAKMSRSNFSHHFRKTTGLSPADFLSQIRMQEVVGRLRGTSDKLETIARDFGFVDASHLNKAIQRHYRMKPGLLRHLLVGGSASNPRSRG